MRDVIEALADAPPTQIDPAITARLRELAAAPTADGIKAILDDCARSSLASDFAMVAMDAVWRNLQER